MAAPVVLHRLAAQGLFVRHQGFVERLAAVESVLAQHALAPGIEGEDGSLVHGFGGHGHPPGGLLAAGVGAFFTRGIVGIPRRQLRQKRVFGTQRCRIGLVAQHAGRLGQALTDAVGQLAGGCTGEGHHQNFVWQQRAVEVGRGVFSLRPQHQAHHQGRQRPGFAGACAGFEQAAAVQGNGPQVQSGNGVVGAHAATSCEEWGTTTTWLFCQRSSSPQMAGAKTLNWPSCNRLSRSGKKRLQYGSVGASPRTSNPPS